MERANESGGYPVRNPYFHLKPETLDFKLFVLAPL